MDRLEVHHQDGIENFSKDVLDADAEGFQLAFESWADSVLPEGKITILLRLIY
jgi:hypothetical protein